ncbi:hypothetical protein NSK_008438 [Nannochloropsis salina CCMP1776]|uniref:Uncharacterized protein n=1 Tax=Nannochloropsis salina CCMP1776 TaxID=1027361 RepID=A0A4D9CRU9_9STRA|nr:hypothetical protein NSK_008438 [Nannochloropsis salina CCMP1776]|eukprot:TFJ80295.1 hypothetical protein NSK_008438 [Nannochloropsis salina CCMP1776]
MLQLRRTFACFPSHADYYDQDEAAAAVGYDFPDRRWTHTRKRLRRRSVEEWLMRFARDIEAANDEISRQQAESQAPCLTLSTEVLDLLARHLQGSHGLPPPPAPPTTQLQDRRRLHRFLASVSSLRLLECDPRRSHPCPGLRPALCPALARLELSGVLPSALAPALPALRSRLQALRLERIALAGLDELLLYPEGGREGGEEVGRKQVQWRCLQRLELRKCDLGDLHPASGLAGACPRLEHLFLSHNRLVSVAGLPSGNPPRVLVRTRPPARSDRTLTASAGGPSLGDTGSPLPFPFSSLPPSRARLNPHERSRGRTRLRFLPRPSPRPSSLPIAMSNGIRQASRPRRLAVVEEGEGGGEGGLEGGAGGDALGRFLAGLSVHSLPPRRRRTEESRRGRGGGGSGGRRR